jgi:hypothetical protein
MHPRSSVLAVAVLLASLTASAQERQQPLPETSTDYESVRLRGGFTIGGGAVFGSFTGPIVDLSLRLGVQFGRVFALMVQSQPNVFFIISPTGTVAAGFGINNSLLAELTLFDFLQLGAGPSLDYIAAAACTGENCSSAAGTGLGLHARGAVVLGGRNREGGRRSGFSLSVNLHPVFLFNGEVLFFTTFGIGGDWF